ncbi:MAG TPA: alpha/beta fold hydrolase [Actinomycetota bacterium]|nr:alpha/beta fold hydrolase [Actinomycetota bacterium]
MRRITIAVLALVVSTLTPVASRAAVSVDRVGFTVVNPVNGEELEIKGNVYMPAGAPACDASVILLVHGLSYGTFAWDFPIEPNRYSVARALAERGYPAVAFDRPGYGQSTKPNGYTLSVEAYAGMVSQMVAQLRTANYSSAVRNAFRRVALMGHSAGTEISELTTALYGGVDALIATAYTHFPSQRIATDFFTGDYVRAAQRDYEYFGGTPAGRTEYMYNTALADPAVVSRDNELANLTPSGEVYSIGMQPSGKVQALIDVPVLLVLAEKDLLFPSEFANDELLLFAGSRDKKLHMVPQAGHSFMLHTNAPETNAVVADWLDARQAITPHC